YLYIAQPPLYRFKKGKLEIYLKDEHALNDYLIENGIGEISITGIGQTDLIDYFKIVARYRGLLKDLQKRYSLIAVVQYIIENKDLITLSNHDLFEKIKIFLENKNYNILNQLISDEEIRLYVQTENGLEELLINNELFANKLFSEASYVYEKIKERGLDLGEKSLIEWLEDIESKAKSGAYIQRYKGLGEMNPEQLWETTMNPENRRLLKVNIEDFDSASDTFTLFMGDEVEPRRNYIEEHAKDVKHLDI
ncbi:MAG: DNA gyrase subunit B, partial [Epsilonproteobacteria bacterium]|nr:DNA gyrase subunit B [Campylobacterota bacterium]